jgi:hypothetical protein
MKYIHALPTECFEWRWLSSSPMTYLPSPGGKIVVCGRMAPLTDGLSQVSWFIDSYLGQVSASAGVVAAASASPTPC